MILAMWAVIALASIDPKGEATPPWLAWLEEAEHWRRAGSIAEAERAYGRALKEARLEKAEDPAMAIVVHNTGFFYHQLGRLADAERYYGQSFRWFAAHQPEYSSSVVRVVMNLAVIYSETGRWDKAEKHLRPWLQAEVASPGDGARMRGVYASVLARLGRYAEAAPLMAEARELLAKEAPSDLQQESFALAISNQAALFLATGEVAKSLANYREALAVLEKLPNGYPTTKVKTLHEAAAAFAEAGEPETAAKYYRRALDLGGARLGQEHPLLAGVLRDYASLLRRTGHGAEAKKLEKRSDVIREKHERANYLGLTVDAKSLR